MKENQISKMGKFKEMFTNWRIVIFILVIIFSLVSIMPNPFNEGAAIRTVLLNSSSNLAGIPNPNPATSPMSREVIIEIDNKRISSVKDYYDYISTIGPNRTVQIKTNKKLYRLITKENVEEIILNETEEKIIQESFTINQTINGSIVEVIKTVNKTIKVPKKEYISHGVADIGLRVYDAPQTNIRKGLDLQGGTRVLLQPEEKLSALDMETLLDNMKQRLNVFGLSDIIIKDSSDLSGNQYIIVEIAGANEEEVKELLAKQGKFEAKIGNDSVFRGGKDITYVCRSADCAGIDPRAGCSPSGNSWFCRFRFSISLSQEAAERQASLTKDLDVVNENKNQYLSKPITLFLDNVLVDQLNIGADLKGRAATDIEISGSGVGASNQEALFNSLNNMKKLQTILITGSLPVKLNIIKTDSISPVLGEEFLRNAILLGVLAVLVVVINVFIRYRRIKIAIPMAFVIIAEITMMLGVAAVIGWNLDLAAIAGIIIAIGTGVDHQIVIADETLRGEFSMIFNWKERIKNAFSIIMGAYFTNLVALIPLFFAGAGLLKGFALTTIIGASMGVFVSRPAYAAIIGILLKE